MLIGSKKTKRNDEKPYIIKLVSLRTPPAQLAPKNLCDFNLPNEYQSGFIATLANISALPETQQGTTRLSTLTATTNYQSITTDLALSDAAMSCHSIYYKYRLKITRLQYLENFLKTQAQTLSATEYAQLFCRYQYYYHEFLVEEYKMPPEKAHIKLNRQTEPATVEAVSAELYQFIGGTEFTPKVRILTHTAPDGITKSHVKSPIAIGSKKITHFQTAKDTSVELLKEIATNNPRQYARLFVSAFILAETDLHDRNWGINTINNTIIKIDHDHSLHLFDRNGLERRPEWPNSFYEEGAAFNFISTWDIRHLPQIQDAKPIHFPTFSTSGKSLPFLNNLENNPQYQQWKYFYFTKALLLTERDIDRIIADHTVDNTDLDYAIKNAIKDRLATLKETLMTMPEYRDFLKNEFCKAEYQSALSEEIEAYNAENCGNNADGTPKKTKEYRAIKIEEFNHSLLALQSEADQKQYEANKNPSLEIQFYINELIKRINKEIALIQKILQRDVAKKIEGALNESISRDITFLINSHRLPIYNLIVLLKENLTKLTDITAKNAFCFNIFQSLQATMSENEATTLFFKHFPDEIIFLIKNTATDYDRHFVSYFSELKKQAPLLLAEACDAMIQTRNSLNETIYQEIVDGRNKESFDDFSKKNPEHMITKIYSAKKAIEEALASYKKGSSFRFSDQQSVKQCVLDKCCRLLSERKTNFSLIELQTLQKLTDAQSGNGALRTALLFIFNDSLKEIKLEKTELAHYEICFSDTTLFEISHEVLTPPKKEGKTRCTC